MRVYSTSGEFTDRDAKNHFEHRFEVPAGTAQLWVDFRYQPKSVDGQPGTNNISLSLFDPTGARGAGHNRADNRIHLSAARATPGYTPGPLQPGTWSIVIDTHMVLPGVPLTYTLTVDVSAESDGQAPITYAKPAPSARGRGWYRGDLHGHTIHSDGNWDVPDLVAAARAHRLDFVTLTDHNTVSPLAEMDSLASDDLLTMGGFELTTYAGHALALGVRRWIDWRVRADRSMADIAADVEAAGGLFVIAHPMSPGDPICTGCDWQYPDMMPGTAKIVEVWNGGVWKWVQELNYNEQGLDLWYRWLNEGHRLVATAGTDIHGPSSDTAEPGLNVVYAESLTEAGILEAIRQGHLYLSSGPTLEFTAQNGSQNAMMGDTLHANTIPLMARWSGCRTDGDSLRLIENGTAIETLYTGSAGEHTWTGRALHWYVIEIRAANGDLRAVTNPIFCDRAI